MLFSHIKKEILLFVTTGMDLEGILLSEISQRKANTVLSHLSVESEKAEFLETEQNDE